MPQDPKNGSRSNKIAAIQRSRRAGDGPPPSYGSRTTTPHNICTLIRGKLNTCPRHAHRNAQNIGGYDPGHNHPKAGYDPGHNHPKTTRRPVPPVRNRSSWIRAMHKGMVPLALHSGIDKSTAGAARRACTGPTTPARSGLRAVAITPVGTPQRPNSADTLCEVGPAQSKSPPRAAFLEAPGAGQRAGGADRWHGDAQGHGTPSLSQRRGRVQPGITRTAAQPRA